MSLAAGDMEKFAHVTIGRIRHAEGVTSVLPTVEGKGPKLSSECKLQVPRREIKGQAICVVHHWESG